MDNNQQLLAVYLLLGQIQTFSEFFFSFCLFPSAFGLFAFKTTNGYATQARKMPETYRV